MTVVEFINNFYLWWAGVTWLSLTYAIMAVMVSGHKLGKSKDIPEGIANGVTAFVNATLLVLLACQADRVFAGILTVLTLIWLAIAASVLVYAVLRPRAFRASLKARRAKKSFDRLRHLSTL